METSSSCCYQEIDDNRICNWSYVREDELPPHPETGEKQFLLRCSRCKEVYYIHRQAQADHWPLHKKVCKRIEDDDPQLQTGLADLNQCLDIVDALLQNPQALIKGRLLLYALQKIRYHMVDSDIVELFTDGIDQELWRCVSKHFWTARTSAAAFSDSGDIVAPFDIDLIFAIPGFVSYMLREDKLLSKQMKQWKLSGKSPPPKQVWVQQADDYMFRPSPETVYPTEYILPTAYCDMMHHIYGASIYRDKHVFESSSPRAAAIVRHFVSSWQSPYVRVSCARMQWNEQDSHEYDENAPSTLDQLSWSKLVLDSLRSKDTLQFTKGNELVPGLTMKQLFSLMLQDESFFPTATRRILKWLLDVETLAQKQQIDNKRLLSPLERLELLELTHSWTPAPTFLDDYSDSPMVAVGPSPTHLDTMVIQSILSKSVPTHLQLYDSMHVYNETNPKSKLSSTTTELIVQVRQALLTKTLPLVQIYLEIVEPRYQRRNESPSPFPREVADRIAEYALPSAQKHIISTELIEEFRKTWR